MDNCLDLSFPSPNTLAVAAALLPPISCHDHHLRLPHAFSTFFVTPLLYDNSLTTVHHFLKKHHNKHLLVEHSLTSRNAPLHVRLPVLAVRVRYGLR